MQDVKFVDRVSLILKSGRGGDGSSARKAFRGKYVNIGGDGGRGGGVYIQANPNIFDLSKYMSKKEYSALSGKPGLSGHKKGADAKPLILDVPVGTIIKDVSGKTIGDLILPYKPVLILSGGEGGKGNYKRDKTVPPNPGVVKKVVLDFQICADVVMIGPANSGKSTLISKISNLTPKISEFSFTTKIPVQAVVNRGYKHFVILEIPALSDEKSGRDLGVKFLKHINRAKVLLFLLSAEGDTQNQLSVLRKILGRSYPSYRNKSSLIVVNKTDKIREKNIKRAVVYISAKESDGIDVLLDKIFKALEG